MLERIGMIGFGEVGRSMARSLHETTDLKISAYTAGKTNRPPYSQKLHEEAAASGVTLAGDLRELVERSDIMFSVVWPSASLAVAREVAPLMRTGQFLVDLTSSAPKQKQDAAKAVEASGGAYIDAVIAPDTSSMPHVTEAGHRVHLVISSSNADAFVELVRPLQMDLHVIPGPAGNAAMAKSLRSLLRKGTMALLWEAAFMAWKAGLDVSLLKEDVLKVKAPDLVEFMAALSDNPGGPLAGVPHLERRSEEMEECSATLRELGVMPIMASASAQRLGWAGGFQLEQESDGHRADDLLRAMEDYGTRAHAEIDV